MLNVAFPYIDKDEWMGGYNYLLNLFSALELLPGCGINPVLFVGEDVESEASEPFEMHAKVAVVRSRLFNHGWKKRLLSKSVVWGEHCDFEYLFRQFGIGLILENACFFGWHCKIPTIAWMPDFQHRHLPDMFSFLAYWKREIGFRAQILSGRTIMLSSESAKRDFERFYPGTRKRTFAVPFAMELAADAIKIDSNETRLRYELPEVFFFLPNQFWKHKNHKVVIKALRILRDRDKDIVVAASGQTDDPRHPKFYAHLKELVQEMNLTKHFRFLGMIPYEDLIGLMRASIAVINPSFFEGWSTTVEESKSLGVPLLLSDIPVHREQAAESAIFFDPTSSQHLVDAVESALVKFKPGPRIKEEKVAASAAVDRSILFVKRFEEVISRAIE